LIGEIVRRITGTTIGAFFKSEVANVLDADFHIGLPEAEEARVSVVIPPEPLDFSSVARDSITYRTFSSPPLDATMPQYRWWRAAEIPAANGHGNARSIAEIHAILANGGVAKGKRFMSEAGCRKALELQIEGDDLLFKAPAKFGMGFGLPGGMVQLPHPNTLFWGGYGGSLIIIDMDARATYGYAMNKMGSGTVGDMRAFSIIMAMWQALGA
jgi:CubicO group peptidase (beta-lactamase class C family)